MGPAPEAGRPTSGEGLLSRWVELDGLVNARDLGGLPTADGRTTRHGVVYRTDNLQDLTADDVRRLVEELGVRRVVDLRTQAEIAHEGPGPLREVPGVDHRERDLIPDWDPTDVDVERVLPDEEREHHDLSHFYLGYLRDRPTEVVAALRDLADGEGATVVHCAAGKDRTGVVVALALELVGVPREEVVADYLLTTERIQAIHDRLIATPTYAEDIRRRGLQQMTPHAASLERFLAGVDEMGGAEAWVRAHGMDDADLERLRARLVG